ncbi:hypothetical protein [Brevundimonas sp.]|uniref:hypothetical protein n=1 Tax=Brevundimonas sp. TaxID=1871086 RepID=UPI0035622575
MRAPLLTLISVTILGLTACAGGPRPVAKTEPASAPFSGPPSAPLPIADHDWFFSAEDDNARLAYGLEASDDLRIGLDCGRASGRLELSAMAAAGSESAIRVESGGDTELYLARSEPSELNDGLFLTADATTKDPVFQRFRRLGWLALWRDGTRETYAPHPATRPDIERFFTFCG